jgi:uncharacterized membrane protein
MNDWLLMSIALLFLTMMIGIFIVMIVWKRKKARKDVEPNYYAFYVVGLVLLLLGLCSVALSLVEEYSFLMSTPMITIGIVFFIIGITNRDKWKKPRREQ